MSLYGWRVKNVEKDGKRAKETNEIVKGHNWPCPFWTWHMKKKRLSFYVRQPSKIADSGTGSS